MGRQCRRFGWILTRKQKSKIRETSREGERNRKFVSDSSLMKFPSISSEEMRRNSRWPWNPRWPEGHLEAHLAAGVATGQDTASSHHRGVLIDPGHRLPMADFGLEGSLFNRKQDQGDKESSLCCCVCFSHPDHAI